MYWPHKAVQAARGSMISGFSPFSGMPESDIEDTISDSFDWWNPGGGAPAEPIPDPADPESCASKKRKCLRQADKAFESTVKCIAKGNCPPGDYGGAAALYKAAVGACNQRYAC